MADYLRASGEDKPDMTVEILLDGDVKKTVKITPDNVFTFDSRFEVRRDALAAGKHTVGLRKQGTGTSSPTSTTPFVPQGRATSNGSRNQPTPTGGTHYSCGTETSSPR
jgi:hypothetical protein